MIGFYRDRFSNAADFTFFMVGAFKIDEAIPLLASTSASLPSTGARTSRASRNVGLRFPTDGRARPRSRKGREPRSQTVISFFADPPPTPMEQDDRGGDVVLQTALRDMLREDLGQTYTVSVGLSQSLPQRGDGHIEVSFGAAPENVQSMADRVLQEVTRLKRRGPSDDLTDRAKESARRDYETSLKQNGYWLRRLQSVQLFGTDPGDIVRRAERIDAVTPHVLQDTFMQYFPSDCYTIATLAPQP